MAGRGLRLFRIGVIPLHLLTYILLGTLKVKCQGQQVVPQQCPAGWKNLGAEMDGDANMCALPSEDRLTMREANIYCEELGASLGIPTSDYYKEMMLKHAEMRGWDDIWINARGGNRMWNWDLNKKRLQIQGCWTDELADRDVKLEVTPQNMSVEACTEKCLADSKLIASVQITGNGSVMCRCGETFGKHQRVQLNECRTACPDSPKGGPFKNMCGAQGKQTVFLVGPPLGTMDSSPLFHAALEVPYWDKQKIGECVVMNNVKWYQKSCTDRYSYICQYTAETCMRTSREEHAWLLNTCVTLHREEETWFEARASCQNMDGRLLQLDGVPSERLSGSDMATLLGRTSWWIGLSIYTWTQTDGMPLPPYNGWKSDEPKYHDDKQNVCVQARKEDDFRWSTTPCNERKDFYCIKSPERPPFTVEPVTRPPVTSIGPGSTPITLPPTTGSPITSTESTPSPTGDTQPQGALTPIFIGAIGAGVGVGFVLIVIGIWCCCRRCSSGSKDNAKDIDEKAKPRRLPSVPGGGRGVHRIKGKTVRYLSDPALSLNHLPPEDHEDEGEYDYIDIELKKKEGEAEEEGVKYQGLTDSMKKKKGIEILEIEYEDLTPNNGLPEDNYIIPMEPPKTVNGIAPPVVEATNEKPPMGMTMPGKVTKTVEESLRIRDSSRESRPESDTVDKPTTDSKTEEAVPKETGKQSAVDNGEDPNGKDETTETAEAEYADVPAAEDSDEAVPPKGKDDDAEAANEEPEVDKKPGDTPSESVIEIEKDT